MNIRFLAKFVGRTFALFVVLFLAFAILGAWLHGASSNHSDPVTTTTASDATTNTRSPAQIDAAFALAAVCIAHAVAMSMVATGKRTRGLALGAELFVIYFLTTGVMSQIETALFVRGAHNVIERFMFMHAGAAIALALTAAIVFRPKRSRAVMGQSDPLLLPVSLRPLTFCRLTAAYVAFYLIAGYYLVWVHSAARAFYGGGETLLSFPAHLANLVIHQPSLLLTQVARGGLWVVIAWLVLKNWKRGRFSAVLSLTLLFGVAFPAMLLAPNSLMPAEIRELHMLEIFASNVPFSILAGVLLTRAPAILKPAPQITTA